ncbi:cation-translocating P-type ATPase [Endothiovibrio diazotrophicus]
MTAEYPDRRALFDALGCADGGLSGGEARARLLRYGPNRITFHRRRSPLRMLAAEFVALFPLLLLAASALSFIAHALSPGEGYELIAAALLLVVVLNASVSFIQNYKVEKLMVSFLDYIPKEVVVLRDGEKVLLDANEVVPGDLLFIQEGDKIPADGVLVSAENLLIDESILTGESEPLAKVALADEIVAACRVSSGATVLGGHAAVLVTGTGRATTLGAISRLSRGVVQDLTPMQRELKAFVQKITWLALGIGGLFFLVGFFIGNPFWTNLIFAIGIIVANVPEGLLPTVTLALTQSSVRMGRRNALVKQILSVETLGGTTVICTDKTGTLTRNRLQVERLFVDFEDLPAGERRRFSRDAAVRPLLEAMALCNDVMVLEHEKGRERFKGDPTETAMVEFVDRHTRLESLRAAFRPLATRAFDAQAKYMWNRFRGRDGGSYLAVKGAPEVMLERCDRVHRRGGEVALDPERRAQLAEQARQYAGQGLRVLSLACRRDGGEVEAQAEGLVFLGHVALVDPPRPEVPAAVAACKSAGIRIVVISGDKGETVSYIARQLGIVTTPKVIEGEQLSNMDLEELIEVLRGGEVVFARIAPEQKLDIVNALKEMGEVVAVTGDGVNDAPALKRADIGIAMGRRGTDVAKEASDIILLDDNFATIVHAVEEGRAVYDNIKKFITYVLTSNIPEILPFIAYVLLPIPLPITVIQILAIDLITDILPAIGLGNLPPEADIMRRPPRRRGERLVGAKTFLRSYGIIGPAEAALSFAVFFLVLGHGGWSWGAPLALDAPLHQQASAAFLAAIIFSQIGNVMACRTNRQSAVPLLLAPNRWIVAGIAVEVLFIVLVVYVPPLRHLFNAQPFPVPVWFPILLAPLVIFAIEEGRKYWVRRGAAPLSG